MWTAYIVPLQDPHLQTGEIGRILGKISIAIESYAEGEYPPMAVANKKIASFSGVNEEDAERAAERWLRQHSETYFFEVDIL